MPVITPTGGGGGSSSPPVTYTGTDPLVNQVTITAAAGQDGTTYLLRFEDADGNLIGGFDWGGTIDAIEGFRAGSLDPTDPSATFSPNGNLTFQASLLQAAISIIKLGGGGIFVIDPSATANGLVSMNLQNATQAGFVVNSFGGTADFVTYFGGPDFNGEFRVLQGGAVVVGQHTAPADGDLLDGQMAVWFDDTNGAAKLMVKAKQADGTVRTGSVALA